MQQGSCSHTWIGEFAVRLIQLRPQTGITSAVATAVRCIHDARTLHPHRAVEIYLLVAAPAPAPRRPKKQRRSFPAALLGRIRSPHTAHA